MSRMRDDDYQQGKIVLLRFWSVRSWVSQIQKARAAVGWFVIHNPCEDSWFKDDFEHDDNAQSCQMIALLQINPLCWCTARCIWFEHLQWAVLYVVRMVDCALGGTSFCHPGGRHSSLLHWQDWTLLLLWIVLSNFVLMSNFEFCSAIPRSGAGIFWELFSTIFQHHFWARKGGHFC